MKKDAAAAKISAQQHSHRTTRRDLLTAGGAAFVALAGAASGQTAQTTAPVSPDQAAVERIIAGWKQKPQEVARKVLAKYGVPHEATAMRLI